jgi:raffinose/stachyose/melibiose transport system permease protein
VLPLIGVVALSFTTWDGLGSPTWAGPSNWTRMLSDDRVLNSLWLTLRFVVVTWLVQTPVSLLLGVFMAGRQRYRAIYSVVFFVPILLSSAAIAIAFKAFFDPNFGLGHALDIAALNQDWLGSPNLALGVVVFVIAWQFVPFHSLLYQGGARQIPASLYEAAMLDGAGRIRQFFSITLPQLRYTIITSSTLIVVGTLTYFDLIFVLTGGGPGYATRILPLDMYLTGFKGWDMGGASVIGVILVSLGLAVSLLLNKASGATRMESQMEGV